MSDGAKGPASPPQLNVGRSAAPDGDSIDARRPSALVVEPDPLVRLLVVEAVAALGFEVEGHGPGEDAGACVGHADSEPPQERRLDVAFVSLANVEDCRRACAEARGGGDGPGGGERRRPLVVGYAPVAGAAAAHRAHRCTDLVVRLATTAGRPVFTHLPASDRVMAAGLSEREADVLVLLLAGRVTSAIAARLVVSQHTARTHCRAVLRKLGAADREALRTLLAGEDGVSGAAGSFCA